MSKLDIINHMLMTNEVASTNSLDSKHPDVLTALQVLDGLNAELQGANTGWWFNTETDFPLSPDENGEIHLPKNLLSIRRSTARNYSQGERTRYVQRGDRLYDTQQRTFKIGKAVNVDMVLRLPIDDLPHAAYTYLKHRAALDMYVVDKTNQVKISLLTDRTDKAWHNLRIEEIRTRGTNAFDTPAARRMQFNQSGGRNPNLIGG
ncbi:hypothetical protein [Pannonibacter sp. SL95]|uniref:hypothetical protein n=1 Tax=Pannonibacter sp. SL95 TaxID=2995153 RepID=UPI0022750C32|nr:hypothetical protein [Pannonibacter sp. SL95]MCY1708360.1 hypothetical protein [Pannonibacter sp. SL95]